MWFILITYLIAVITVPPIRIYMRFFLKSKSPDKTDIRMMFRMILSSFLCGLLITVVAVVVLILIA